MANCPAQCQVDYLVDFESGYTSSFLCLFPSSYPSLLLLFSYSSEPCSIWTSHFFWDLWRTSSHVFLILLEFSWKVFFHYKIVPLSLSACTCNDLITYIGLILVNIIGRFYFSPCFGYSWVTWKAWSTWYLFFYQGLASCTFLVCL